MNLRTILPASLVLATFLSAGPAPVDELVFAPSNGTQLSRTYETAVEFVLDDMQLVLNGEAQDMPIDDGSGEVGYELVVSDALAEVDGGRPTDLVRTYDTVRFWGEGDGNSEETSADEIEGVQVRFLWDEEEEAYAKSFPEEGADEAMLAALAEDLDLRVILPEDDVDEGDSWDIPASVLGDLLLPGMDLEGLISSGGAGLFEGEGEMPEIDFDSILQQIFESTEATCTHGGEDEGAVVLELAWAFDGDLDIDIEPFLGGGNEFSPTIDAFDFALLLELKGNVDWDPSLGTMSSYEIEGEFGIEVYMEMSLEQFEMEMEQTMELSGSLNLTGSIEAQ